MNKRVTVKLKHPNPLFEQWLTEWRDTAIERDSKMQHCFTKALQSLRKYPLPLESGRDCKILQGFGEKLCKMIDTKVKEHKQLPDNVGTKKINTEKNCTQNLNRSQNYREYVPRYRSGPYAILITLYEKSLEPQYPGYMFKTDIIKHGSHLCDKSFVRPEAGSFYTAWSSMKILLEKKLIIKQSSPAKFSLTDEGIVLAHKLFKTKNDRPNTNETLLNDQMSDEESLKKLACVYTKNDSEDIMQYDSTVRTTKSKKGTSSIATTNDEESSSTTTSQNETFIFTPHSFDIILLVDKQETAGNTKKALYDEMLTELNHLNVRYEIKHLKVGDYTWVCRQNIGDQELVLPYIVERKRMDDFGLSIKDGRFHEQKFRLKRCGIHNLIYLIESYGSNTHVGLPLSTLYQAATNTFIQDGFSVKFTDDLRGTAEYLASFTLILEKIYKTKTIVSCPKQNLSPISVDDDLVSLMTFNEFNQGASKSRNFKVHELFIRQLLQLKGMSVEKALAIVEKYPTPNLLYMAYKGTSEDVGANLLTNIQHGKLNKKIGCVISKVIYQLFTSKTY